MVARSCAAVVSARMPCASPPRVRSASIRSSSIAAAPAIVCAVRSVATSRLRPTATPASTSASTIRKKYAGPEPDTAVTASMWDSGTVSTPPTESNSAETSSSCGAVTKRPLASAVTPAPTNAAALGIARTTGVPAGSLDSK